MFNLISRGCLRRYAGARHTDDKGDVCATRSGQTDNPATFAAAPKADFMEIDVQPTLQQFHAGQRVTGKVIETAFVKIASRAAAAAFVIDQSGHTIQSKKLGGALGLTTDPRTRPKDYHHCGMLAFGG